MPSFLLGIIIKNSLVFCIVKLTTSLKISRFLYNYDILSEALKCLTVINTENIMVSPLVDCGGLVP